jgi:hypothetical protein
MLKIYQFDIKDTSFSIDDIFIGMGYSDEINHDMLPIVEDVFCNIEKQLNIQAASYSVDCTISQEENKIISNVFSFFCGKTISNQLSDIRSVALFVVTLGKGIDVWSRECFAAGDPVKGFVIDSAGSMLIEKVADILEAEIREQANKQNLSASNRFSPGYCGWNVEQQQILFAQFPKNICGITLSETSLMVPIKSVSGIIGIGKDVTKKDYHCSLCDLKDCYLRKN